jgi:hypothetical protein
VQVSFNFLPPFFLVVTSSNSLAVVVHGLDSTKKKLYKLVFWWGCGDKLAFHGSSYGSNQTFHSRWKLRWSRSNRVITLVSLSRPFNLEKKKKKKKEKKKKKKKVITLVTSTTLYMLTSFFYFFIFLFFFGFKDEIYGKNYSSAVFLL